MPSEATTRVAWSDAASTSVLAWRSTLVSSDASASPRTYRRSVLPSTRSIAYHGPREVTPSSRMRATPGWRTRASAWISRRKLETLFSEGTVTVLIATSTPVASSRPRSTDPKLPEPISLTIR
ncbi:MAG: hypothetical protein U0166_18810 [Acidobacteriota bacterium]